MKCFDTYVLVEIHDENPKFINYLNEEFVIPDIIMAEFYGVILRGYNEKTAEYLYKKFKPYVANVSVDLLVKAVRYRYENKTQNLSFFDCVGYVYALEKNIPFVTGDKEFENKENVEYIKK